MKILKTKRDSAGWRIIIKQYINGEVLIIQESNEINDPRVIFLNKDKFNELRGLLL